jgi:hypothetical protein
MTNRTGWASVGEWALALGLVAFAVISGMSIGMFVIPVALGAVLVAALRNQAWPEAMFGGFLGVGVACVVIAYLHRADARCPPMMPATMRLGRGEHFRCGGLNPIPWLTNGLVLAASALLGYRAFRHSSGTPRPNK